MADFINPYTFVPLPQQINRASPVEHHRAVPGNLSGWLTVQWTVRTPILLPREGGGPVRDGRVVIPGSSVKGALRSLHETLMGGCLRVVDEEFVPVYREPAVGKGERWRLAVVREATAQGRPVRVRVSTETAWVSIDLAAAALGRPPQTGDTLTLSDIGEPNGLGRRECTRMSQVSSGDEWVLLVGDSGARRDNKNFFCAAGRLPETDDDHVDDDHVDDDHDVLAEAWDDYVALCEDANDMRLIRGGGRRYPDWKSKPVFDKVEWPKGTVVGRRRVVTGRLWRGDVVWVRVADGVSNDANGVSNDGVSNTGRRGVDRLSMAALWRTRGTGPLGDRVPAAVRACDHRDGTLCVSCRLFGAADTGSAESGEQADQRSYAGHLRIGDAVAEGVTTQRVDRLAPMGAPRPGAGQFYLRITDTAPASSEEELASARWGAEHDEPDLRLVRGRKFYWHGDPRVQNPQRHQARPGQRNDTMTGAAHLVPENTVLSQRIAFDNVPPAELGSLLLTLLPGLVLPRTEGRDHAQYLLRLGGGKPLGLGSCSVEVTELRWWDAVGRYTGQPPTVQTPQELVTADMRSRVAQLAGRPVFRHWPELSRILRADGVDPKLVWYPLGGEWHDDRRRDESFRFFAQSDGRFLKKRRVPIVALPDPADAGHDQRLSMPPRSMPPRSMPPRRSN